MTKELLISLPSKCDECLYGRSDAFVEYLSRECPPFERIDLLSPLTHTLERENLRSLKRYLVLMLSLLFSSEGSFHQTKLDGKLNSINIQMPSIPRVLFLNNRLCGKITLEVSLKRRHIIQLLKRRSRYNLCVSLSLEGGLYGAALKDAGLLKLFVYDDHDLFHTFHFRSYERKKVMIMERSTIRAADLVFSVSEALAELRRRQGAKDVVIIPNGVDSNLFLKADLFKKDGDKATLVYMGSLQEGWGLDLLLTSVQRVANSIPGIKLLVLGEGPAKSSLEKLTNKLGLRDKVKFLGAVPHSKLPYYLGKAAVGVALYQPGFSGEYGDSIKVKEYMSAGLPVITTSVGGLPRLMRESCGGFALPFEEEAVSDGIVELLTNNHLRKEMSEHGREYVNRNYSWNKLFNSMFQEIFNRFAE